MEGPLKPWRSSDTDPTETAGVRGRPATDIPRLFLLEARDGSESVRAFAVLATLLVFAGCLDPEEAGEGADETVAPPPYVGAPSGDDGDADEGSPPVEVPAGCDETRPATVHTSGGELVVTPDPRGLPCMVATVWGTGEPSLGVTSAGTLFLYPTYQAPAEALATAEQFTGLGIARSTNEGGSFERLFSHADPAGVANFHPYTADPFMYVDPYTDRVFMEDLAVPPFNCANLSFSDDEGESWTQTLGGCLVWDHVGWGSGPATVSSPDYPVVIQRCAITLVATTLASQASGCQKTLDGGMTWQPPGDPAFFGGPDGLPYVPSTCHGAVHHVFVDHRGWTWLGRDWCATGPWVALSKDEGATWTRHHVHGEPLEWHDVGVGADASGLAYAFWIDNDRRPLLSVSKDDGQTWSEPWDIGPPGLVSAGNANIAPAGRGKAGFSYAGTFEAANGTECAAGVGQCGVQAILAAGYGLDTDHPVFHTAVVAEPINPGDCNGGLCDGQADFLDATVGPDGTVWGSYATPYVAAGRLWGAPSLWDDADPDGVYGGWDEGATDG